MLKYVFVLLFFVFAIHPAGAQSSRRNGPGTTIQLSWKAPEQVVMSETEKRTFLVFEDAVYEASRNYIPYYSERRALPSGANTAHAAIANAAYEEMDAAAVALLGDEVLRLGTQAEIATQVIYDRKQPFAEIRVYPFRKNPSTGKAERLLSFSINMESERSAAQVQVNRTYASTSVLATGSTWHRIGVGKTGVVKLDYNFFKNTMGVDPAGINPQQIRLYGNGNGQLPFKNSAAHYDDLKEYAIQVVGESDGSFDQGDYVLFYGTSPHRWDYDTIDHRYHHKVHAYCDTTYYFLNWDLGSGKRIGLQASSGLSPTHTVSSFDDYQYHEEDLENLIKSGREWYGEKFDILTSYSFSFSFPYIDPASQVYVRTDLISRDAANSLYQLTVQSLPQSQTSSISVGSVPVSCYYCDYANPSTTNVLLTPASSNITVTLTKQSTTAIGWLNYIEVNARRLLQMPGNGQQLSFRDASSVGAGNVAQYNVNNMNAATVIWDVTDFANITMQQGTLNGSTFSFTLPSDSLKNFVAFDGISFNTATYFGETPNQNLHGLSQIDNVIVVYPAFLSDANELAQLHLVNDGLSSAVVTPQQIYNEFSSGAQDVTAIRDFVKMLYDRAAPGEEPKYLLLYGDGSYDNKHRLGSNINLVPTFQNLNSLALTESYVSDEFFGLLDNNEGSWDSGADVGYVDIGIGRFPVQSSDQSKDVLAKIKKYEAKQPPSLTTSTCAAGDCSSFGDWRTWVAFIGDDEDANVHTSQSDQLATLMDTTYDQYNVDKIYLDAYQQESTSGGDRYPDVNKAITQRVEKGCLILNYTGHGGEVGLAHERVVETTQILGWKNPCNLPLFVTATCEFSRFDDPGRTSAGEDVLLNANGGGIGLLTTVRLVYSTPNFNLNKKFYQCAFNPINGEMPRIGDIYRITKVNSGNNTNNRNFTLLGDPALRLAYPVHNVITTHVNNTPVNSNLPDTARALSLITVKGFVADSLGNKITNYNGVIYPTVFDKPSSITTLSNDGPSFSPPYTFKLQKNFLYKGKASVTNGDFSFSFVVPKDIAYQYGFGRISYYADNGDQDAAGWYENIVIGGSNPNAVADNNGPKLRLFLNDSNFVSGGMTDDAPKIYALVSDSNGVNTVGNGIGHDMVGVLDDKLDEAIVLNDYYISNLNSYQKGTIIYPFSDLSEGAHKLSLKVWDVYNNSTTSYTDFVVSKSAELALDHVLNYPNPFTTRTQFFFGHNKCCTDFNVQVQVFTVSGKLVKTIDQQVSADGFRSTPIEWDGKDDYGDKIGKGVYVYRVKVRSTDGQTAEKYEKLVILN